MSIISTSVHSGPGFDFWEFVHCGRCRLPFSSDSGPTIPFWLAQCGHIVCNTHIHPDQVCTICGMQKIRLVPLQREMDPHMMEWFRPIPEALDAAANAAKLQQETMASLIHYYKTKLQQYCVSIGRLTGEINELKRANACLAGKKHQFHQQDFAPEKPHSNQMLNSNGKRPLVEPYPHDRDYTTRPKTISSSSSATLIGPARLTLPPGQHTPKFTPSRHHAWTTHNESQLQRPRALPQAQDKQDKSNYLIQRQYSYIPPSTPQFRPVPLAHTQATPKAHKLQPSTTPQPMRTNLGTFNPTSSSSSGFQRFRPATALGPTSSSGAMTSGSNNRSKARSRHGNMGPPPTPQRFQQQNASLRSESGPPAAPSRPTTNRFLSPAQRFATAGSNQGFQAQDLQRMDTPFVGGNNSGISTPRSRPSSQATRPVTGGGGRMPFVPASRNGLG
ncbi:hypothetical protein BD779DRAFT_1557131 [Infundibulicybe gibba]|nr:hypothetical protein BD779DRAFT_1557131 [Infundibulicybe gibba]